jgi:cell division protein FtsB
MSKRLITFVVVIFCLFCIIQICWSIVNLWQKGGLVTEQVQILKQKQSENDQLKQKLVEVESNDYIEKEARNKLNMQKEGDVVVVLPKNLPQIEKTSDSSQLSNWQKWAKMIF